METNLKHTLDIGTLRYNDDQIIISVEKGEHCDHYDVIMISNAGMIFAMHIETIEQVSALPFQWDKFTFVKHPDNAIVSVIPFEQG